MNTLKTCITALPMPIHVGNKHSECRLTCKHFDPNLGHDVDLDFGIVDDIAEYNEHDSGDGAGNSRCEGAEEGQYGDRQSRPTGIDTEGSEKDGDKTGACASQEKGEHPVRGRSDKREGRYNVCRQGNLDLHVSIYCISSRENTE